MSEDNIGLISADVMVYAPEVSYENSCIRAANPSTKLNCITNVSYGNFHADYAETMMPYCQKDSV